MIPLCLLTLLISVEEIRFYPKDEALYIQVHIPSECTFAITTYFRNPGGQWWLYSGEPVYHYADSDEIPTDGILAYGYFPTCNETALRFHRSHFPQPYCGCNINRRD